MECTGIHFRSMNWMETNNYQLIFPSPGLKKSDPQWYYIAFSSLPSIILTFLLFIVLSLWTSICPAVQQTFLVFAQLDIYGVERSVVFSTSHDMMMSWPFTQVSDLCSKVLLADLILKRSVWEKHKAIVQNAPLQYVPSFEASKTFPKRHVSSPEWR